MHMECGRYVLQIGCFLFRFLLYICRIAGQLPVLRDRDPIFFSIIVCRCMFDHGHKRFKTIAGDVEWRAHTESEAIMNPREAEFDAMAIDA